MGKAKESHTCSSDKPSDVNALCMPLTSRSMLRAMSGVSRAVKCAWLARVQTAYEVWLTCQSRPGPFA